MSRLSSQFALIVIAAIHAASTAQAENARAAHPLQQVAAPSILLPAPRTPGTGLIESASLPGSGPGGQMAGPLAGSEPAFAPKPVGISAPPPGPTFNASPAIDLAQRDAADRARGIAPPWAVPEPAAIRPTLPVLVTIGRDRDSGQKPGHAPNPPILPPRPPKPVSPH